MMAGSLNHMIGSDGRFSMETIENLGDASEALEECFVLILDLADGDMARVRNACRRNSFPVPEIDMRENE